MKRLILLIVALMPLLAFAQVPTKANSITLQELVSLQPFAIKIDADKFFFITFSDVRIVDGDEIATCETKFVVNKEPSSASYACFVSSTNTLAIVDQETNEYAMYEAIIYRINNANYLSLTATKNYKDSIFEFLKNKVFIELK